MRNGVTASLLFTPEPIEKVDFRIKVGCVPP